MDCCKIVLIHADIVAFVKVEACLRLEQTSEPFSRGGSLESGMEGAAPTALCRIFFCSAVFSTLAVMLTTSLATVARLCPEMPCQRHFESRNRREASRQDAIASSSATAM